MRNDADRPHRPAWPGRADGAGAGAGPRLAACLLIAVLAIATLGCTTAQMSTPPSADTLDRIPPGTWVRITTREGDTLRIKVSEASADAVSGRDRYFRQHEVAREQVSDIEAPPQNDWVVALLFFLLVFVART
jgi:hypothetical protein